MNSLEFPFNVSQNTPPPWDLPLVKFAEDYQYFLDGDVIIGGILTVNSFKNQFYSHGFSLYHICSRPIPQYYKYLLTFRFAIDEINQDQSILPNVSLGYHIFDSCLDSVKAVKSVLQILSGPKMTIPNYSCREQMNIAGFIGDQTSATTVPIAQILALYQYTQLFFNPDQSPCPQQNNASPTMLLSRYQLT